MTATQLSLPSDRSFASYEQALAHVTGAAAAATTPRWSGTRPCWTCCSNIRSSPTDRDFSINPDGWCRLGLRVVTVLRFLPPSPARCAPSNFEGDPGLVRLDPRWYQAALRLRRPGIPAHPGRHRSSAVPVLPGDPVPPFPRADSDRDRVHRGALHHSDRVGVQSRARRAVVSAADRDADRDFDRLHGAREHRRREQRASPLDDRVRLRPGARIRLLLRAAADAAIRRARIC